MRILIVHPVMTFLGGGERLCCETIQALSSKNHELTMLASTFDPGRVERYFGYDRLFDKVSFLFYRSNDVRAKFGTSSHILRHSQGQNHVLKGAKQFPKEMFDLVFSTQDAGYIPDIHLPVFQWGYFPRPFRFPNSPPKTIRTLPLRLYYHRKISRIGLVLAISRYSQSNFDREWKRPTALVYPACNMVSSTTKRNLIVTAARAVPEKRLELFWRVAKLCPDYEFAMLLTQESRFLEYSKYLAAQAPDNGRTIFNPPKEIYHKFLGEAKVYLHLMPGEHFGITIVEAMSAGCVPVVHDSGGPKEIVQDDVGYRWQRIEEIPNLIDDAVMRAPSEAAKQKAKDFTVEKFGNRLSSILSEVQG